MASMMGSRGIRRIRVGSQISSKEKAEMYRRQLTKTTQALDTEVAKLNQYLTAQAKLQRDAEARTAAKPWNRFKAWLRKPLTAINMSKRSGQR